MTNDRDITRYEINEHGEIPLSCGRYVRYESYQEHVEELLSDIRYLQNKLEGMKDDYTNGHEEGWSEGYQAGWEAGR